MDYATLSRKFIQLTSKDLGFTYEDIFAKKSLQSFYPKLSQNESGFQTIRGRKILNEDIALIIQYYREQELTNLFGQSIAAGESKEQYEDKAKIVREKYTDLIEFYASDWDKYKN